MSILSIAFMEDSERLPRERPSRLTFVAKISHFVSFLPSLVAKKMSAFLSGVLLPCNF
jgi:hypothetical protein